MQHYIVHVQLKVAMRHIIIRCGMTMRNGHFILFDKIDLENCYEKLYQKDVLREENISYSGLQIDVYMYRHFIS